MQKILLIFSTLLALLFAQCPAFASSYPIAGSTEDAAHSSGDRGVMPLGVRKDANDTALSGTDGDYTPISVNDVGNVKVQLEPSRKATYKCTTAPFTPLASATDMVQLFGSGTKKVTITEIAINYTGSPGALPNDFYVIKRSTANSSGTPTTPSVIPLDSASSAATAVVKFYASGSNPTLGTGVGTLDVVSVMPFYFVSGSGVSMDSTRILYKHNPAEQALTLRGTGEGVVVNNNGASLAGTSTKISVTYTWTEE